MTEQIGNIRKMKGHIVNNKVFYTLPLNDSLVDMNELIGQEISLQYTGRIHCTHCNKITRKSFFQGYCYNCFTSLAETDSNILHPEKDKSYLGISRDIEWSKKNTLVPHYVYLSFTGNIKVGVTRCTQIPTRWIDQGASTCILLARTPNRHIAGTIEVFLKKHFADKTKWQQMLSSTHTPNVDILTEKEKAKKVLHQEFTQYIEKDDTITLLEYPTNYSLQKPTTISFDKTKEVSGKLVGIKGQYLIFENNTVLNIRKHGGYEIILKTIS